MDSGRKKSASEALIRILAFTLAISVMSATMFNIVLPEIRHEFGLSMSEVSWATTSYLLVFAIGSVIYGKLADRYHLKTLITVGFMTLVVGSVIGMLSEAYGMLIIARVLQAVGAAVIPAISGIIPVRYFPPEHRGRALGISMAGGAIGSAAGPAAAALLVSIVHWRILFFIPLLTLLALPFYYRYLHDNKVGTSRMDWPGCSLLAGAVAMLLLSITNSAGFTAIMFVVLLVSFIWRIQRAATPFVQPDLFKNVRYSLGLAISFAMTGIGYSLAFLTPTLLTQVHVLRPGLSGIVMVPAAIAAALLSQSGGKMADNKGISFLFRIAASLYLLCFLLLSSFTGTSPIWIALFLILGGVGQAFMSIVLAKSISLSLPNEQSGVGMGLLSMLNFIAGAVFASLYGTMVDQGATQAWNPLIADPSAYVFSNIYVMLTVLIVAVGVLFIAFFNRKVMPKVRR
ncbi:MFS transporter [Paenibacillus lautus]|uniref:MFS transporter n=1 Tax=Paenibacillus lautus TaxID=1401 RepID=UPI000BBDC5E2|nr:MFS transporter [Paenibacillus lautus]PCL93586.1 antiporter [Paenibacillus lautus]